MADLKAWAAQVVGRYIDVDGWAGAQCWDLSQAWLTACNGGTLWAQPSNYPGLAAGSWEVATGNTANTDDLLRHVTPIPGNERGLPGDLIIWAYGSADYPISHTAVLIEDRGPILHTLSQNSSPARPDLPGYSVESSGPTIYQDLPRAGILGFLRPRATITGQTSGVTPIPEEGQFMNLPYEDQVEIRDNLRKLVGTVGTIEKSTSRYLDTKISAVAEKVVSYEFPKLGIKDAKGKPVQSNTTIKSELGWLPANVTSIRAKVDEVKK